MGKLLRKGDVIELTEGHTVYADIPKHFCHNPDYKGCFDLTHDEAKISGELMYLAGRYVVIHTASEGGCGGRDPYPDGHHVFCERVTDGFKVDFFQTGCFTAMIPDIQPVGRATRKWVDLGPEEGASGR